jgi:ribosomal protein S18 acetylase RimI-like enzyme
MKCQLRRAAESDKPFLYQLQCLTMRRHIETTWGWDEAWQKDDFEHRFERCAISIIEDAGESIGSLWLEERPTALYIADIQVLPEWQGRGIGTAVLRSVIADAVSRHLDVELVVLPVNTGALRLYERMGFLVTELGEPFVHMRWRRGEGMDSSPPNDK